MTENVELCNWSLRGVFEKNIRIPDYQRIYCWTEKNVYRLLDDIKSLNSEYRLGTLIVQKKIEEGAEAYDIIDGQQRLVTLSLILLELGDETSPLLSQSFNSNEAHEYVAYNRFLIKNYLGKFSKHYNVQNLMKNLTFNVLVLSDSSLDLAYTFFSNENSRGCPLSDFDLLKAHHLRYVVTEQQALHLSSRWDAMLLAEQEKDDKEERTYERSLGLYIFRLRKWLNYNAWNDNEKYRVKNEYEAAATYDEIPPFGEQFQYKEPIQGGSHFFAYVSQFVEKFQTFAQTSQYKTVHKVLTGETHNWFRDVIESFLFGYYLKFGTDYLSEALVLIIRIISRARYENRRIHKNTIFDCARESKIVPLIDQATSPTFFIAALVDNIKRLPVYSDFTGIQKRYSARTEQIEGEMKKSYAVKNLEV